MKIEKLSAHMSNYTPKGTRKIDYIAVHYTANNGDTAWGNCNYFSKANRNASAHYFVDEQGVWQSVEDMDTAWHCGTNGTYKHQYCRNSNSIGIEMCSKINSRGTFYIEPKTIVNTQKLVKKLMKKYNIPIENVLRHYDITGKICPKPFVENKQLWVDFKEGLVKDMTIEEAKKIIQDTCGFDDNTMKYLDFYKYSESLILRLAEAIEE